MQSFILNKNILLVTLTTIDADGQLVADRGLAWIKREMFIESDKVVSNDIVSTVSVSLSTEPA